MGYYGGYYFDPTYWLVILGAFLCLYAEVRVSTTFRQYSLIRSGSGLTGAQAAQKILQMSGIYDVKVEHVGGKLTDHYDPSAMAVRLSDDTYNATSVAAIGVAAHECGHALQHHKEYAPLSIRTALAPAANIGSNLGIPIVLVGSLLGMNQTLVQVGIWVFALAVLFQIVTLPVEFNASRRALAALEDYGLVEREEIGGCRKVLKAAALTYVAAAASSILQLIRLLLLFGKGKRKS